MFQTDDQTTPGHYGPSQTALLLLDFHSMFVEKLGGSSARAALGIAAEMRIWAKAQGIEVVHALIDTNSKPFPTCKDKARLEGIKSAMAPGGTEEPVELLDREGKEVTFTRRLGHISALKSPGLNHYLQEKGIKSLILTGLSTSGCVMRTAIAATDAEYVVTVISDGCADPTEDVHGILVGKVLNNRAYCATGAKFREGYAEAISSD